MWLRERETEAVKPTAILRELSARARGDALVLIVLSVKSINDYRDMCGVEFDDFVIGYYEKFWVYWVFQIVLVNDFIKLLNMLLYASFN